MFLDSLALIGLYLNPFLAGNSSYIKRVYQWADSGYINAVVIDVKTEHGSVWYPSELQELKEKKVVRAILPPLSEFVGELMAHRLYPVARVVVFADNYLPEKIKERAILDAETGKPWQDVHKRKWLNPYDTLNWDYVINIAEEVAKSGFKEIHFDYVRFPSQGKLDRMLLKNPLQLTKEQAIQGFLRELFFRLYPYGTKITSCLFGFAPFWKNLKREGQNLYKIGAYSDNVALMLYPSHFGKNFMAENGREIRPFMIYYTGVKRADEILKKFDTEVEVYIQGFNYLTGGRFGPAYILEQIRGAYYAGARKFFIWHAGGEFKETIKALKEVLR